MTKKELALKTVAELRELAAGYGHKLAARLKSGIVDELAGVIQKARKNLKATSKKTAKTVKAVKKAVAAGKEAAVAAKKTKPSQKTAKAKPPAKPPTKEPAKPGVLDLMKKDLQGMTVPKLKETARKLGLKHSYPTKDEFVASLAKDISKLRTEARKKAVKPAAKKAAVRKKAPAAKKARPVKPKVSGKPSAPLKERVVETVKPALHAVVEKAKGLAAQVRERMPAIKPAKPRISKKPAQPVSGKEAAPALSMPRVATILPATGETAPPVELLAAIAVEPTELFVSWVLDPSRKPSGPLVLRVREEGGGHLDIPIESMSGSAYVRVHPGRHYHVDAGTYDADGAFITIRRSNPVVTPPGDVQPLGEGKKSGQELPEEFYVFTPQEYGSQ